MTEVSCHWFGKTASQRAQDKIYVLGLDHQLPFATAELPIYVHLYHNIHIHV